MRATRIAVLAAVGVAAAGATGVAVGQSGPDKSASLKASVDISKPKNIILFIGDGMGDSEVTSGRYYAKGAAGRLNMDSLPFRGDVTTYNVGPAAAAPYPPNYVPDSAPTAAAWSSGIKTLDGRLGQGPSSGVTVPGTNYETYMEIAKKRGLSTGNVSTAEITDATPAGPSAHISQRGCQGPNDTRSSCPTETKAAGGLGSIAEQQADNQFDVVLGGGRARYAQPLEPGGTKNVIDYAKEKGYKYVATEAEMNAVGTLAPGERLLGLFHDSNMTTEFQPLIASDTGAGSATTKCQPSNRGTEPTLAEMTDKAIKLLEGNQKGFVLQVEGASIDKRDHASDACGQIGELIGMDDALGVAQEFQKSHPDTLIIVSADHSHTSQIIGPTTVPRGQYTTLQTADGAPIRISYGTAAITGSQSHTGATVPVFASGPRAADVTGTIDQTALFPILTNTQTGTGPATSTPVGGDVGGSVPATLALTVSGAASFPAFVPGVAKDYVAGPLTANVTSTAGLATLTVADAGTTNPGTLTNGTFALAQPLQARAKDGAFAALGATPTTLVTYTGPVANDAAPIEFKQSIASNEPLRTGTYAKTLTLTLSTTTP
ncbi:alkaline phosphatase [Solirubrobacter pauli]|uniref:Alkaline phosphatase n=1 Tax=Solirubrobacter pauli TaxID=166793 RepID=A0A660L7A4_9ACTN|nr:alkaline phosphatase [Solirubrobacter pauli]RKQ87450.1 alkaline phosphatase [Solirubrobacter pauli]